MRNEVEAALRQAGIDPADDLLDAATLAELVGEFGADFLATVAASFRTEAALALDALDAAVAARDAAAAERQAHFIKGSALYLALARLAALCEQIEADARTGLCPGPEAAAAVREAVGRGLAALTAIGLASPD